MRSEHRIEDLTFETIASRMKADLQNPPNKVEGSFASDNIQAVAKEILMYYSYVDFLQEQHYAETAIGEYLDKKAEEVGVFRKQPTKARGIVTFEGQANVYIPEGFEVYSDKHTYVTKNGGTIGQEGKIDIEVEAVEVGKVSNVEANEINKFEKGFYGLTRVYNKQSITNGSEIEDDEALRERTLLRMRYPGTSGNQYHYMHWAREVDGVGRAKVFPLWQGAGTVKVSILDSNQKIASEELIAKVKHHIDHDGDRKGESLAPIGALLTVSTASKKNISISGTVLVKEETEANSGMISKAYKEDLQEYIDKNISYKENKLTVAKMIDILYSVDGVEDIDNFKVNGSNETIKIGDEEVLTVESVTLNG